MLIEKARRLAYGFRNLDNQRRRVRFPAPGATAGSPSAEGHFPLKIEAVMPLMVYGRRGPQLDVLRTKCGMGAD
jgi:hypothetical protein